MNRNKTLLISEKDVASVFENNLTKAVEIVEKAFLRRAANDVYLPDKISQIFDQRTQNRINCMPSTLVSDKVCGVKWVAVFPENPLSNMRNVTGTMILSEIEHGYTLSVMDGTYITGIRTATVGAVAAKYLAKTDAASVGFIGAGNEARRHFEMLKLVRPSIKCCRISSRREATVKAFIEKMQDKYPDVEFVGCADDYESAVTGADIIVTATSTQKDLLKADWVKPGATYIHVGGWEDEFAVAKKADKIVCDEWEAVKHRSQTLSRMYIAGELADSDIYSDLGDIITGKKPARENEGEFIYFNSVGLAFTDVEFAKAVYDYCRANGLGPEFEF